MRTFLWMVLGVGLTLGRAEAGGLVGTVQAKGPEGAEDSASGGKYASRKYKFAEKINFEELRDFVVYIDQAPDEKPLPPAKPVLVVTQKDAKFHPHVLPILVGTTVEWPNEDDIFHNVFSMSDAKEFDLGLYKAPQVKRVTFDKPGRVDVFCNIHSSMNCIVLVVPHPAFTKTDNKGRFALPNLPPGTYKVKAWHERLPSQTKEVTVSGPGDTKVDFTLGLKDLPKY